MTEKCRELLISPNYRRLLMDQYAQSLDILAYKLAEGEKGADDWNIFLHVLSEPQLNVYPRSSYDL